MSREEPRTVAETQEWYGKILLAVEAGDVRAVLDFMGVEYEIHDWMPHGSPAIVVRVEDEK